MNKLQTQSGVGLIEVLVAVAVVSIGFLAAARMQIAGMRNSQNAYFLSQANFMVRDMTDRMRANNAGVLNESYRNLSTNSVTTEQQCMTNGVQCTPTELASADLHAWRMNLHAPENSIDFKPILASTDAIAARGEIAFDAATEVYTISVKWAEFEDGNAVEQVLSVQMTP